MSNLKELKGRIQSVSSSEKITGAMKMISSAKMRKAEGALRRLRPFRDCLQGVLGHLLSSDAEFASPLTAVRPVHRHAIVVLGSDDGLCGAYNVNIYKYLLDHIRTLRAEAQKEGREVIIEVLPVGSKMVKTCQKLRALGVEVNDPAFEVNSKSEGHVVQAYSENVEQRFVTGQIDRLDVVYMRFLSAGRQRGTAEQLLPMQPQALVGSDTKVGMKPYLFEPDAQDIFTAILPMYLLSTMQEVFIENRASEQAARIMAMQSANDNAKKLLDQLRLEYNKVRQANITTELLDIVGGQVR